MDWRQSKSVSGLRFKKELIPELFLAKSHGHILLTGDQVLRELAHTETVECHGDLWLFDQMNHDGAASFQQLHDGLIAIADHPVPLAIAGSQYQDKALCRGDKRPSVMRH